MEKEPQSLNSNYVYETVVIHYTGLLSKCVLSIQDGSNSKVPGLGHSRTLASAYMLHLSFKSGVLNLLGHLKSIRGESRTDVPAWQF